MTDQGQSEFHPPRSPLNGFQIRWDNPAQSFSHSKKTSKQHERQVPDHVTPLLDWAVMTRANVALGRRFQDLFYSKLDVGDDDMWHFSHALGKGGYGAVALFEKRNQGSNGLEDQVVIKTTKAEERYAVDSQRKDLALEAALMDQTNNIGADGMLTLRDFKYYNSDCQWRFYFEYCPYGDLERLRVRYKAYGRYLPELFLWHTFYWLARTLDEYSTTNSWFDTHDANWGRLVPNGFLLHSDIKTANILLGPADPKLSDPVNLYPIPRVADLGLAEIQSNTYDTNIAIHLHKGTEPWLPPEVRFEQMLVETDFYPFGDSLSSTIDEYRKGRHHVTSSANVWAMGAVMFSLLSLQESYILDGIVKGILVESNAIPGPESTIITDDDFNLEGEKYYSMALRDLIKDCLRLRPDERPDEENLRKQAFEGYSHCLRTLEDRGFGAFGLPTLQDAVNTDPDYKLYFRENEIDTAPDNYQVIHDLDEWWWTHRFISDYPWIPPSWGRLFPETMPTDITAPRGWPDGFINAYNDMRYQVWGQRFADGKSPVRTRRSNMDSMSSGSSTAVERGNNVNGAHFHHHHRHVLGIDLNANQVNGHRGRSGAPSPPVRQQTSMPGIRQDDPGFAAIARNRVPRYLDSIDQALLNLGVTRTTDRRNLDRTSLVGDARNPRVFTRQGVQAVPNGRNTGGVDSMSIGGDVAGVQRTTRPSNRFTPYRR